MRNFVADLTRSSAIAERPCDVSCHWIFRNAKSLN